MKINDDVLLSTGFLSVGGMDLAKKVPNFYKEIVEFVCDNIPIICSSTIRLKFGVDRSIFPFVYYRFYY